MKIILFLTISLIASISDTLLAEPTKELIVQAESLRLQAKKAGFEWTTIAPLIKQANQALKNGDQKLAEELAQKALLQAKSALKQADYAKNNWQKAVL